ncbi:MAG: hypothetical protein AAGF45_09765 [Pseudomonadota bacterium]
MAIAALVAVFGAPFSAAAEEGHTPPPTLPLASQSKAANATPWSEAQRKSPDCFCTGTFGERIEIGAHACLYINGRPKTALCDMSLNNPAWRIQHDGCPTA